MDRRLNNQLVFNACRNNLLQLLYIRVVLQFIRCGLMHTWFNGRHHNVLSCCTNVCKDWKSWMVFKFYLWLELWALFFTSQIIIDFVKAMWKRSCYLLAHCFSNYEFESKDKWLFWGILYYFLIIVWLKNYLIFQLDQSFLIYASRR